MKVAVIRLWEDGKRIPKWQWGRLKSVVGELRFDEHKEPDFRRTMRVARLVDNSPRTGGVDLITPLTDAAVVWIKDNKMSIAGIEHSTIFASVAQTWLVEIISLDD